MKLSLFIRFWIILKRALSGLSFFTDFLKELLYNNYVCIYMYYTYLFQIYV